MWRKPFSIIKLLVVSTTAFLLLEMFWALWQSAGITRGAVTPHSCCVKFAYLSAVFSNTHSLEFLKSGRLLTFSVPCWAPYDSVPLVTGEFTKSNWECQRWQAPTAGYFRRNLNTPLQSTCIYHENQKGGIGCFFQLLPPPQVSSCPPRTPSSPGDWTPQGTKPPFWKVPAYVLAPDSAPSSSSS